MPNSRETAEDRTVAAVKAVLAPFRHRLEIVERDQHALDEDTRRRISRFEEVNQRTSDTVIHHVERLSRLESIPDQIKGLDGKIDKLGVKVEAVETRVTSLEQKQAVALGAAQQRAQTLNLVKWVVENWMGILSFLAVILMAGVFLQVKLNGENQNNIILKALEEMAGRADATSWKGTAPTLDPPPELRGRGE